MQPQLQQKPLFFFVFLSFIIIWSWGTLDGVVSDPQTNLVRLWCDQDGDNDGSILKEILNETFRDLRAQIEDQSKLFGTAQAVKANIAVYGLFQCRNYLSIADCLACFNVAAVNIRNCSARAYGARLVYDGCFLRYESTQEFDQASESWNNIRCGNQTLKDSPALASTVQQVLTNLGTATPRMPGFYAATKTAVPNSNGFSIYAIAQCVETLSQSGCQNCIDTASGKFQTCLTTSNAESYDTGCFMRYSTNAFFSDNQTTDINGFLKKQGSSNKAFIIGIVIGGLMLFLILLIALFAWIRPRKSPKRVPKGDITGISQLKAPVNYNYKDLKSATKNFSLENKLGEGGFGAVYKGTLKNGKVVAVKKLTLRQSKRVEEEFESEVKLVSNVHHRNLVRLLGCCSRGNKRILVYEYMEKTSLDRFLFGKNKGSLNWKQRYDIILGTARGLAYLHEEFHVCIIHRDIKTNNILIDDDLQPKIADFGLARLLPEDKTHLNTRFAGTLGYTAPEYAIHGQLSEKVDVYSYGVVILEIISGRRNNELNVNGAAEGEFLLQQAWKLYKRGIHIELVDDTIDPNDYDVEEVKKIIEIGLLCTQGSVEIRPKMSEVVALLQQKGLSEDMRPTMPILIEIN
ncbi:cysteine-rich receptor-like protein kinase 43 isoform X1 [Prosopis cineraria]|uniref:cysteine-rich receptor-like protein kinase 43 isoform X1 n=1 Tax=Prosopis cineraria TaxID=364024 RepID=UPI00240EDF7A|nr:cysteine-rich receptor-like protein kinase 43 isoform X1 [Prosopis cineraria]